jgi:hypothetical protein
MAAPKVELGWDNTDLQAGAAKAQGILSGFATRARSTLGKAMSADVVGGFGQLAAAVGSLTGLKSVIDDFDRLNDLSVQLDTSVESLQRLGVMAKLSGSDVETLVKGVSKLTRSLADAENSEKTAESLKQLGVSASKLRSMSLEEQIMALSEAFISARGRGEGFAEVFDLMGRNGAELIPLLMQGREELQALADTPVLSQEQVQRLAEFNDQLDAGVLKLKAWTAESLLGLADFAAVSGAALFGGLDGSFTERVEQAATALAQSKLESEEAAAAQEKQREAAREAADWAKKIAAAQKEAAESIEKGQKELEAQEKRMQGIREQINQAKGGNLKQKLSPDENLELAKGNVSDIEAKMKSARDKAYMDGKGGQDTEEVLQLELQRQKMLGDILTLEQQISAEKDRQQQAEAEKTAQQNEARSGMANDLQVLELRARGRNKEADALERQARIQQEARRIAEETGMSQQESLRIAQTKSALEERAANRQDGGRQRIQGYSAMSQGTADDARSRAEQRMADARSRVQSSYDRFMPGLKGGPQDNPLAQRAAQNAAADKAPAENGTSQQAAQMVAQILPQILEALK